METFLTTFDDVPDPRASNTRHELCGLLVVGFVVVLCGATSCAEMAALILRRRALDGARRDASKRSLSIKLKRAGRDDAFLLKLLNQLDRS